MTSTGPQDVISLAAVKALPRHRIEFSGYALTDPLIREEAVLLRDIEALAVAPPQQDAVCQHGTAMDVHCCNCHSGFIFDKDHECPVPLRQEADQPHTPASSQETETPARADSGKGQ